MALLRFGPLFALVFSLIAGSITGCSPERSEPPATGTDGRNRPNILLIVADDLGYSDLGSYGGEIHTPNLDALAERGVRFADFSAAPTCSTTRAMLLSGADSHLTGMGALDTAARPRELDEPGYEGYLNFDVVSFPALLKDAGYHTYMAGKWHLGDALEHGPENRGFEQAFVLPGGAATHFSQRGATGGNKVIPYRENGEPAELPEDFYSSAFFTDKLIEYIDADRESGRPFFAYASYTAPHWPLQAPEKFIDNYQGVYDEGYEAIRAERNQRQKSLGFFDQIPEERARANPAARDWEQLDETLRSKEARRMQVYAAMVEALDHHVGRLLDYLKTTGELDNTAIIFMSDNGAEGNDPYVIGNNRNWIPETFNMSQENWGAPDSYIAYGPGWAGVSSTPLRLYKTFPSEGGIRVPAIFVLPDNSDGQGKLRHEHATVLDIAPTVLELAGAPFPEGEYRGRDVHPLQGRSMLPLLTGETEWENPGVYGLELFNRRAVRRGDWKLVRIKPPYGPGRWQLYDLDKDPGETKNLADSQPEKLREMIEYWDDYARKNNVIIDDYSNLVYGNRNFHYER